MKQVSDIFRLYYIAELLSVPIYDGRPSSTRPFRFAKKDFDVLQDWPQYINKFNRRRDVPKDAVVTLGYTVGMYESTTSEVYKDYLTTNILFVMVILD